MSPEELQVAVDDRVQACLDLYSRLCRPCQAGQLMVKASGFAVDQLDRVGTTALLDKVRDSYKILARGYWECSAGRHQGDGVSLDSGPDKSPVIPPGSTVEEVARAMQWFPPHAVVYAGKGTGPVTRLHADTVGGVVYVVLSP